MDHVRMVESGVGLRRPTFYGGDPSPPLAAPNLRMWDSPRKGVDQIFQLCISSALYNLENLLQSWKIPKSYRPFGPLCAETFGPQA